MPITVSLNQIKQLLLTICYQFNVQEIGLMSYDSKIAFKIVNKQHMLYCNTVTISSFSLSKF